MCASAVIAASPRVGIAGSTRIGDGVMIGGAAAINGHITIGDRAQIGAMSGVARMFRPVNATAAFQRVPCAISCAKLQR